jgi:CubicO group peptidase (beta-lactamase class C family)
MRVATTSGDYAIDWALILVILIQLRERRLTWTVALLAMAVAEVSGRSLVQAIRRHLLATPHRTHWPARPRNV